MSNPTADSSSGCNRLDELAEEFVQRHQRGERPSLDEYTERYPELADEIRELFPALVLMQDVRPQPGAATGPYVGGRGGASTLERLGDYRILREVGRGGMGVVYEAEQESLGRHVALKVLPAAALLNPTYLERFRREAKAAARLHHTNIVPVFGVGEQEGVPFYAMQFIRGEGLDKVLADVRRLCQQPGEAAAPFRPSEGSVAHSLLTGQFAPSPVAVPGEPVKHPQPSSPTSGLSASGPEAEYCRGVARIGFQVAEALAYAHRQGILHRDIKPSNLLLDLQGAVWITDFGLAKAEGTDELTNTGDIVGTMRFMAPERFEGKSLPQSDVYALGLTLYELLTLRPAFEESNKARLIERVLHEPPAPLRKLEPRIPRDLETVVHKAIAKRPEDRYQTAGDLAADLQRFLAGEPVRARRTSPVGRLWRWCKRHPAPAALVLVSVVAVLALVAVGIGAAYNTRLTQARDQAEEQRQLAEGQKQLAHTYLYFNRISLAEREWWNGNVGRTLQLLDECPADLRGWEWHHLQRQCRLDEHTLRGHTNQGGPVAYNPDGKRLASTSADGTVRIWNTATGREERPPLVISSPFFPGVAWSPDGRWLAAITGDSRVQIWKTKNWEAAHPPLGPHIGMVWGLAFSPDSKCLAVGSGAKGRPGEIKLWNAETGQEIAVLRGHTRPAVRLAFSPDGKELVSAGNDFVWSYGKGEVIIWDVAGRKPLHTFPHDLRQVLAVAFSPNGKLVATTGEDAQVTLRDTATRKVIARLSGHMGSVWGLAFSPDSKRLISGGEDQTIRVWDVAGKKELAVLRGHTNGVNDVAFSPDGRHVASSSDDRTVKLWDLDTGQEFQAPLEDVLVSFLFGDDGRRVALVTNDQVRLWNARTGRTRATLGCSALRFMFRGTPFSSDGKLLVVPAPAGKGGEPPRAVELWDAWHNRKLHTLPCPPVDLYYVAFSVDGRLLAVAVSQVGMQRGEVIVWDVGKGRKLLELREEGRCFYTVTFSPDGRRLVTSDGAADQSADSMSRLTLWEAASGRQLVSVRGSFTEPAFSGDGRFLAVVRVDNAVSLLDSSSGAELRVLRGHQQTVFSMAFSPDGKRLATGGADQVVKLWDTATGQEALTLRGLGDWVTSVRFSADGNRLLASDRRGHVKMWDAAPRPDEARQDKDGGHAR